MLDDVFVKGSSKRARVFERASERVVVFRLAIDTCSGCINVVEMTLDVGTGLIFGGKVVVRFEELLVLDNVRRVAINRGVFVRAHVPDRGSGSAGCSGGGKRCGRETNGDVAVELGHGTL